MMGDLAMASTPRTLDKLAQLAKLICPVLALRWPRCPTCPYEYLRRELQVF